MRFDVYGRYRLEILRTAGGWQVYRETAGKRVPAHDLVLPPDLDAADIPAYLDDLLHELSPPGGRIVPL
ncbi:DUF7661 family protein [Bordetella genomosp. 2]|uniref:DUF7661 domain-containing protein n=1 Tax=Bordetella genomosp. 2 TaxID=1983456 RepID=A0A261VJL1_9BORD|nr:hypothetical protein [Bordetella genomosp. 2]OZI73790.1 hypothetical protein CAL24_18280 [Bordetella genomosp. 2]